jgi:hypothetical protein
VHPNPVVLLGLLDQPDYQTLPRLFPTLARAELASSQAAMVVPGVSIMRIPLELIGPVNSGPIFGPSIIVIFVMPRP